MRALVLSGGGSRGSWQVGALKYLATLEDLSTGFDFISGTSVGAINAAGLAQYPPGRFREAVDNLERLWTERVTKTRDIWRHRFPPYLAGLWKPSIGKADALDSILREELDFEAVLHSGVKLRLPAVDLLSGQLQEHAETSEDLVSAIMASAAFPLVFAPVEKFGKFEIDGGIMDFAPLQAAIDSGADEIWIITTQNVQQTRPVEQKDVGSAIKLALRMMEIVVQDVYRNDLKAAQLYNRLIDEGIQCGNKRYIKIYLIEPPMPLGDPLNFDGEMVKMQIERGHLEAAILHTTGRTVMTK